MEQSATIQALINGSSLATFMIPDASIPTNKPRHLEGFQLHNIIINKGIFWGFTRNAHGAHVLGQYIIKEPNTFCYSNNDQKVFLSYAFGSEVACWMPLERYEQHEFVLREDYELIWSSDAPENLEPVVQAVQTARPLKMAMLDEDGIWNIRPVDLCMFHTEEKNFLVKSELFYYPIMFRDDNETRTTVESVRNHYCKHPQELAVNTKVLQYPSLYGCYANSLYYNYYDICRDSRKKYKHLKIYGIMEMQAR